MSPKEIEALKKYFTVNFPERLKYYTGFNQNNFSIRAANFTFLLFVAIVLAGRLLTAIIQDNTSEAFSLGAIVVMILLFYPVLVLVVAITSKINSLVYNKFRKTGS